MLKFNKKIAKKIPILCLFNVFNPLVFLTL